MSISDQVESLLVSLYGEVKKEMTKEGVSFLLPKGLSCLILSEQIEPVLKGSGLDLSIVSLESETILSIKPQGNPL